MFARIILEGGARRFQIVAEMAVEFRAKTAMFADKLGQRRNGFKAGIFFKACALEAFIVVNRPFLRIRNRRGGKHGARLTPDMGFAAGGVDPAPVQNVVIVSREAGHIDAAIIPLGCFAASPGRRFKGCGVRRCGHGISLLLRPVTHFPGRRGWAVRGRQAPGMRARAQGFW